MSWCNALSGAETRKYRRKRAPLAGSHLTQVGMLEVSHMHEQCQEGIIPVMTREPFCGVWTNRR
ncbi:hypothetical protein M758_UG014600 [Ceratodon purpureus]|nr:hypothetical protein M758_UG014600 [Ceratodon purpureus]